MATDTIAHQERQSVDTGTFALPLQSIGLAFTSQTLVLVQLATLVTVGVFIVAPFEYDGWSRIIAPAIGIAGALIIATGIGWNRRCYWDDPKQVDQWNFGRFCQRFTTLEARELSLGERQTASPDGGHDRAAVNEQQRISRAEANAHLDIINKELDAERHRRQANGPTDRWINGSGYVDLWRHLYSFEEALILREDLGSVMSKGRWDQLRLKNSEIENKDELLKRLEQALSILEERVQHVGVTSVETTPLHACSTIRDTRIIINDFRIQKLEGLLETRNRLILIGSVTAFTAYLLLVFAILAGASQSHVIAGFTFLRSVPS